MRKILVVESKEKHISWKIEKLVKKQLTNYEKSIKLLKQLNVAEWSSLVARRAHNPEVVRFESHLRNQYFFTKEKNGGVA